VVELGFEIVGRGVIAEPNDKFIAKMILHSFLFTYCRLVHF
jgi:hypothetical protein